MPAKQNDREACNFCLTSHLLVLEQWEGTAGNRKKAFSEGDANERGITLAVP